MIHYQLHCGNDHDFDGWFANSSGFEEQQARGLIACPHCGNTDVRRALMAPAIGKKGNATIEAEAVSHDTAEGPAAPAVPAMPVAMPGPVLSDQMIEMIQKVRAEVEKNCDYVGTEFAEEARKIHYGEADPRGIYGETTLDEAQELAEEGIAIAPLPFMPRTDS
jgi:hypothetical protein